MDGPEREIIRRFAGGERALFDEAVRIYRNNIRQYGLQHGDAHFDFMSEVDCPVPDLLLRARYRRRVLDIANITTTENGNGGA